MGYVVFIHDLNLVKITLNANYLCCIEIISSKILRR